MIELILLCSSLILGLLFSYSYPGKILNLKIYDLFSLVKPRPPEWKDLIYVDIDDQSIELVGRWPFPREEYAHGMETLKAFGARKVLFDIEFLESSSNMLNTPYYADLLASGNLNLPLSSIQQDLIIQPDRIFLNSMPMTEKMVYLACRGLEYSSRDRTDIRSTNGQDLEWIASRFFIPLPDARLTNRLPVDPLMEIPVFPLFYGAKGVGFTTAIRDLDGALRKIALFRIFDNHLVPQLALPVVLDELDIDRSKIEIKPGRYVKLVSTDGKTQIKIPVTRNGEMYINWSGHWTDNPFGYKGMHLSFGALVAYSKNREAMKELESYLSMNLSPEERAMVETNLAMLNQEQTTLSNTLAALKDKIVITGHTPVATTDLGATTIDSSAPLVILQGNLINTIISRQFLTPVPLWINLLIAIAVLGLTFLLSIKIQSAIREVVVSAFTMLGLVLALYITLAGFRWILNYGLILSVSLIGFVGFIFFKFVLYDKDRNQTRKAFMQYLSPEVVKQVLANPDLLKLGGERREITAFFSDVANFTSLSELLTPEEVVGLLNEYLTAMTDIILAHGGTVDKYEGDAIVAFFGAPIPHTDHARRCALAALDMARTIEKLKARWKEIGAKWIGPEYPEFAVRMGINTGPAVIGNMGSQQRMDYTMMGDTVNTASRFEGANKVYGTRIMLSEMTHDELGEGLMTRKLDVLKVKGKNQPIAVFELVDTMENISPEKLAQIEIFERGLSIYFQRNWTEALEVFQTCAEDFKDTAAKTYIDRCIKFQKTPPPPDWDGAFILVSK